MKLKKRYLYLLFLGACSTGPVVDAKPPAVITLDEMLAIPASKYPATSYWDADYDKLIALAVKQFPIQVPCDNPTLFWKSVAKFESGWKRNTSFHEPAPLNYSSDGLLQLSLEDERGYKCGFKTKDDVRHPLRNLYCGVKILNKIQNLPKYKGKSISYQAGQYWSVLRDFGNWPKANGKLKDVRAYFNANSKACIW